MNYFITIPTILSIGLALVCYFLFSEYNSLREDNALLRSKTEGLITSIKEFNNAQMVASGTITKIQEKVKYIKSDCNCYNLPIDESISEWVRGSKK